MADKLLLIGGGGHCKSVLDSLLQCNACSDIGIVDNSGVGTRVMGVRVIGCDDDLAVLLSRGFTHAFITLGSVGNPAKRVKLFNMVQEMGFKIPNVIDPSAVVSINASLAEGIFVGRNAVVNAGAKLGTCAIINTGAIVEHDCEVGAFAHIATGAVLCGGVCVGQHTHIGAGSVIRQSIEIGEDSVIGAGSVVVSNISNNCVAYGNPAREV